MDNKAAVAFLNEMARYFDKRPTNGEDRAHWANVYNAKNCREIAAKFETAKEATIEKAGDEYDKMRAEYGQFPAALGEVLSDALKASGTLVADNQLVHIDEYMFIDEGEAAEAWDV